MLPVVVEIRSLREAALASKVDQAYREPVSQPQYGRRVSLKCQVRWSDFNEQRMSVRGDSVRARGDLILLKSELSRTALTLKKNDRIAKIGGEEVEFYIIETQPVIHKTKVWAIMATFTDRRI